MQAVSHHHCTADSWNRKDKVITPFRKEGLLWRDIFPILVLLLQQLERFAIRAFFLRTGSLAITWVARVFVLPVRQMEHITVEFLIGLY